MPTQQSKETEPSSWRPLVWIVPPWSGSPSSPGPPPLPLLRNWQPQPLPGGETLLPGMTRTSLRLRLLLLQSRASGARASARSLRSSCSAVSVPSPPRGRGGESWPGRLGPKRPRGNEEGAAARGKAGFRESRLSLVGGRRGSLGSRSASAAQTSNPALRGRGLLIGRSGRRDEEGGGRGGACGRRRR